ncbi:N-acetylglutamate synthase-like GNAT family acetyltransferase [Cryobacterium psychrotolerans]|nr:N-acetylglutamate synthase-like GNAT family acetyltransferase [Cryobacterium psychrotolerans]
MGYEQVRASDVQGLRAFLTGADLTLAGLETGSVRLWVERDADRQIVGSNGYEISEDRRHALIRSVAVAPQNRTEGSGSRLA